MSPHKEQELVEFHQQWLAQPITRQLIEILREHKDSIVNSLVSTSFETKNELLHRLTAKLATSSAILTLVTSTEDFVAKVKQLNNQ